MSNFLSELGGLTGGVGAEALAFAAGFAAARALDPAGTTISQDAWHVAPVRRLDPGTAAAAASEGYLTEAQAADEASYSGHDADRFGALYHVTLTAPGTGELLAMLRRDTINDGNFTHGLRKAKLEPMWDDAMRDLQHVYVGLGDIAMAIIRGAVPTPSWVPVAPPTSTTHVQRYPVVDVDPVQLAAKLGYSEEMLRIMVARSGLSLGPELAARAHFRDILALDDYRLAVAEGDLRTEWADALLAVTRQILTAGEYAELQLRGFLSADQRRAKTAQHGMDDADSDLLYDLLGRAPNVHTITKGLAFGGEYGADPAGVPDVYRRALERGNLRPEYYDIAYHDRFLWPSAFVLRALVQAGDLTAAEGEQILRYNAWEPELARKVAARWATAKGGSADPHIAKAETQLWTTLHRSYLNSETDQAEATTVLGQLGVGATAVPRVLALWDTEAGLTRKTLTPSQIKKAYKETTLTLDEATTRLVQVGYNVPDAHLFLGE